MDVSSTQQSSGTPAATSSEITSQTDRLANRDIFMQLLVAQLKYQNPASPADGVEFISQLTQFSQLEQTIASRQELAKIREALVPEQPTGATAGNPVQP